MGQIAQEKANIPRTYTLIYGFSTVVTVVTLFKPFPCMAFTYHTWPKPNCGYHGSKCGKSQILKTSRGKAPPTVDAVKFQATTDHGGDLIHQRQRAIAHP
jgi:hypothetical protein